MFWKTKKEPENDLSSKVAIFVEILFGIRYEKVQGYTYFGTKGSVLGEMEDIINSFMINTLHLESIFTENFSFEIASADKGVFSSEEAEGFFDEFRRNQGTEFSVILENNKMT